MPSRKGPRAANNNGGQRQKQQQQQQKQEQQQQQHQRQMEDDQLHAGARLNDRPDAQFALKCQLLQQYYAALGKAEWWWIMDDAQAVIGTQLCEQGYCVLDGFLSEAQAREVREEVQHAHREGKLEAAGLVNGKQRDNVEAAKYTDTATRGDVIGWFDTNTWPYGKGLETYLLKLGTLASELATVVPELKRITSRSKAMVACYPGGGAHYVAHVDNDGKHPLCRTRVLTALLYLNSDWRKGDGGELAVLGAEDSSKVRHVVEPLCNRVLLFWSDWRTPHEVRPAQRTRYSLTIWLLDNTQNVQELRTTLPGNTELPRQASGESVKADCTQASTELVAATETDTNIEPLDPSLASDAGHPALSLTTSEPPQATVGTESDSAAGQSPLYVWMWDSKAGAWELHIQLRGCGDDQNITCPPAVELSDVLLRVVVGQGRLLLCLPLPCRPGPLTSKWSRRQQSLTIRLQDTAGSSGRATSVKEEAEVATEVAASILHKAWASVDGFLPGPDADALRELVTRRYAARAVGEKGSFAKQAVSPAWTGRENGVFLEEKLSDVKNIIPLQNLAERCERLLGHLQDGKLHWHGEADFEGWQLDHVTLTVFQGHGGALQVGPSEQHIQWREASGGSSGCCHITFLVCLNPFWHLGDGSSLRMACSGPGQQLSVEPLHGRLLATLCRQGDECHFEVLPGISDTFAVRLCYYMAAGPTQKLTPASIGFDDLD